jgi:hypothetical protein
LLIEEDRDQIEERWSHLNPIFIMGMQRSGTTAIARAMNLCEFTHFAEGHLWFEVMEPFRRFHDPSYRSGMRRPGWTLGDGRDVVLEKYIALTIDRFHRDNLPKKPVRWVDKSPGFRAVRIAPTLAKVFPKSQFIFMARNATTVVHSGMKLWGERPDTFRKLCTGWVRVMSTWRRVRAGLEDRYIEIYQEELVVDPDSVAARLTDFLEVPESRERVAELFGSKRVNTAFPDKSPGDYDYDLGWTNRQKAFFMRTCAREMETWGYDIPFSVNPFWIWQGRLIAVWDRLRFWSSEKRAT